ncbi:hypothetical protein GIB67_009320 [Kingdonia uniflora]|uniref:NAD-dependent epimerase/dehydratase domain-containing protein n=1 Tax=Kingdonia uniflora TaxID=39325 RepID=A0A7J7N2L2_9MAGN|nr:hypothetical protein GIB67_009320 [Kingdonia uniflora]
MEFCFPTFLQHYRKQLKSSICEKKFLYRSLTLDFPHLFPTSPTSRTKSSAYPVVRSERTASSVFRLEGNVVLKREIDDDVVLKREIGDDAVLKRDLMTMLDDDIVYAIMYREDPEEAVQKLHNTILGEQIICVSLGRNMCNNNVQGEGTQDMGSIVPAVEQKKHSLFSQPYVDKSVLLPPISTFYQFLGKVLYVPGGTCVVHFPCELILIPSNKLALQAELIEPAVTSTLNVLKACSETSGKRVVIVSSVADVLMNPNWPRDRVKDEACWSDKEYCRATKNWYYLAKTAAENDALEYAKENKLDVVTVCPSFVIGLILQSTANLSNLMLITILRGSFLYAKTAYNSIKTSDCLEQLL